MNIQDENEQIVDSKTTQTVSEVNSSTEIKEDETMVVSETVKLIPDATTEQVEYNGVKMSVTEFKEKQKARLGRGVKMFREQLLVQLRARNN